ncbi:hypothetical protein CRE_03471 [Caenorhabditis remanei]|uniref:Uncharacterized protein n=1 Tax=Caenorhabditis remanei TaxID=31234 RepID=E3NGP6_CAERE|nr:hypothetical protein CRE_03471 [Caenorhabditis remanei]
MSNPLNLFEISKEKNAKEDSIILEGVKGEPISERVYNDGLDAKAVKERKVNETVHKFPTLALAAGAPQSAAEIGVNLAGMSGPGAPIQTHASRELIKELSIEGKGTKELHEKRAKQRLLEDGDPGSAPGPSTSHTGSPASGEPSTSASASSDTPRRY